MKLFRFGEKGAEKPGVVFNGKKKDCSSEFNDWNRAFFNNNGLEVLKALLEEKGDSLPGVSDSIRIGSAIARPGMIMCIGLNYADHAEESGMEIPEEPVLFMKATNTLAGPYDLVKIPKGSEKTDWEVELGIVLSRDVYLLESEAEAEKCIAGYTIVHDVSERAYQLERGGQWVKGKSCPGFSPVGPYLVTADAVENVGNLKMTLSVNGQLMQNGSTSTMIFDPKHVVWYLSQFMQLEAGDLITTGTPPGVGFGMNPPIYLKRGDVVELSVEGLGEQKQLFE